MKDRTARGTALVNLVALQGDEHIEAVIDTRTYEDGVYLFFATRNGIVKKTRMSEYDSSLRSGLIAINLNEGDELVRVIQTTGSDDMFMVSRNGMTIRFSEDDVRSMGRATAGVRGMKLRSTNDGVVSCDLARDDAVLLFVSSSGHGKRTPVAAFNRQGRGGQGVRGMRVTEARGTVVAAFTVDPGPRSSCSRRPATSCGWASTRSPSRDGTRPACAWPASTRAIRLSPWHRCSKPSRTTSLNGETDDERRRRRTERPAIAGEGEEN